MYTLYTNTNKSKKVEIINKNACKIAKFRLNSNRQLRDPILQLKYLTQ